MVIGGVGRERGAEGVVCCDDEEVIIMNGICY